MGLFDIFQKKLDKPEPEERKGGPFVSFILLDEADFSVHQLAADLKADWGIEVADTDMDEEKKNLILTMDGMMTTVSLMPAPIPENEAVENAKTNFLWPEAVSIAQTHRAHLLVAVLPHQKPLTDAGILLVKLCVSALKQPHATGINTLGTVFAPEFYIDCAKLLNDGNFPIMNLVFFGLYSRDNGKTVSGYTYGMSYFDKDELEVQDSAHTTGEVYEFLTAIAGYVIESDVMLRDGETIGFSAEQKLSITKSAASAIDGESLKIGY